jgi:hypothetical protein
MARATINAATPTATAIRPAAARLRAIVLDVAVAVTRAAVVV